jgi:threonine dehydrogenase-like Zn-dependent dehydrogenase
MPYLIGGTVLVICAGQIGLFVEVTCRLAGPRSYPVPLIDPYSQQECMKHRTYELATSRLWQYANLITPGGTRAACWCCAGVRCSHAGDGNE